MSNASTDIDEIKDLLPVLPENALHEAKVFVAYLLDREKRRNALVESVREAEGETPLKFDSVEDTAKAVFDETDD